ncbi:ester cyclase [Tahibacter amnicola]|uniref:Ester cyclase n=1 Tax=Tahibacter amnicola TaxID=2976241 RepID=A0ABY6B8F2_9GAMM|nr:ester cyclase [Tahibacter amnicola]UXI65776.1 ester cyclase [Tahibacter amnicola]
MSKRSLLLGALCSAIALVQAHTLVDAAPAGAASEVEHNTRTARRVYEEGLNQGRFEVRYTDDFIGHGGAATFTHEQGMAEVRGWRAAFPDLAVSVDRTVAQDDLVAVHWTARGTNTGDGNGITATGKRVQISGIAIFRFKDGAIAEEWTSADALGLRKQLGLLPTSAKP